MSQAPSPYTPNVNFGELATTPITTIGLPGTQLDTEFAEIATAISATQASLAEVQRDDGALRNGIVTTASLSAEVINQLIAAGVTPRIWLTGTAYKSLDMVSIPQGAPVVVSGTFTPTFTGSMEEVSPTFYTSGPNYPQMQAEWDGGQWTLTLLSSDVFGGSWYSEEAVASPDLVETWTPSSFGDFTTTGSPTLTAMDASNPPGTYLCVTPHTSTASFSNDILNWALLAAPPVAGLLVTDTFTGNGSTTAFTMSAAPVLKDNAQVFINGAYQAKSSYTVSGVTLTLATAPALGAAIEVVVGVPSEAVITTVADGSVSTVKLVNGAVSTAKLATGSVTTAKMEDDSVTAEKLAASAVVAEKLANAAVTEEKIAPSSVTETKIANLAITSAKIRANAVTGEKIINGAVTEAKIAPGAVTPSQIADNAVANAKIAGNAVTAAKIADNAVTTAKIAPGAVTTVAMADGAVTAEKVASNSVTATKLSGAQTGPAPIYGVRAWVNFNANKNSGGVIDSANTPRLIRSSSSNVASVLKTATGRYTVTFTTAMPNADYSALANFNNGGATTSNNGGQASCHTPTTASLMVAVVTQSGSFADPDTCSVMVTG